MHLLCHYKSVLELELLESILEFKLPRVANIELLSIIDRAGSSFRSLRIRSTSSAPAKLEEMGLIA
jgi:hypothetical protein